MIEVMEPGLTQGNLLVTIGIVSVLILISEKYRVLDRTGVYAAAALGITVGALGHWTWLVILLGFLGTAHKATKWRFEEKQQRDFPNQVMDTEAGAMSLLMVDCLVLWQLLHSSWMTMKMDFGCFPQL